MDIIQNIKDLILGKPDGLEELEQEEAEREETEQEFSLSKEVSFLPEKEEKPIEYKRPQYLADFIGNTAIRGQLETTVRAIKKMGKRCPHTLFFGSAGTGKCINKNSYVFTDGGMKQIGTLGNMEKEGFQEKTLSVCSLNSIERTSHFYNSGVQKTIKIRTRQGFEIEGTENHKILTCDDVGNFKMVKLSEIKAGKYVAIGRGQNIWGNKTEIKTFKFEPKTHNNYDYSKTKIPTVLTKELCRFLGLLVGDGTVTHEYCVQYTTADKELIDTYKKLVYNLFGCNIYINEDKRSKAVNIRFSNKMVRDFLKHIGLGYCRAGEKKIPDIILSAPKKYIMEFIKAYFDCDGYIDNKRGAGTIEASSASKELLEQIHIILLNFGIVSCFSSRKKLVGNKYKIYYYISMYGKERDMFLWEIGFSLKRKQGVLGLMPSAKYNSNRDIIPYGNIILKKFRRKFENIMGGWGTLATPSYKTSPKNITTQTFNNQLKKMESSIDEINVSFNNIKNQRKDYIFWDMIKSTEKSSAHVVDLSVPSNHLFFSNGFINHNTTLAKIISNEVDQPCLTITGNSIGNQTELMNIIFKIDDLYESTGKPPILFIDEIHSVTKAKDLNQTIWLPLIEDFIFYNNLEGKLVEYNGVSWKIKTSEYKVPEFTVIGATTNIADLDPAMRRRFPLQFFMKSYTVEELTQILLQYSGKKNIPLPEEAALNIAKRSRYTPATALSLLETCGYYQIGNDLPEINNEVVNSQMGLTGIDENGLKWEDMEVLKTLAEFPKGLGCKNLAGTASVPQDVLEEMVEPFLKNMKLMCVTNKRIITQAGLEYIQKGDAK